MEGLVGVVIEPIKVTLMKVLKVNARVSRKERGAN
jgi:hypothetical protein